MHLLKLGSVAVIASAITAAVIVGPSNVGAELSRAAAPVTSRVQGAAAGVSTTVGQVPRTGAVTPGGPAVVQAPAVGQTTATTTTRQVSTDATVQVYQQWRPSVVTVINSVVAPGFRSEPQPQGTRRRSG